MISPVLGGTWVKMRHLPLFIFVCLYTSCLGQSDDSELGIAVNGDPLMWVTQENGQKYYKYFFVDQEILSISVINNDTYQLTDCFEDSNEPCWLPEGRMFLKERPEQTYCCIARHNDPARTTRLTVAVTLLDDKMPEIRLKRKFYDYQKVGCDADKLVVGRAFRITVLPQDSSLPVNSVRCRDENKIDYDSYYKDQIRAWTATKDPNGPTYITFPNTTLDEPGKYKFKCTYYTSACRYSEKNGYDRDDDLGPGCWLYLPGYTLIEDHGVSCDLEVHVVNREYVASPAGFLSADGAQFSGRGPHALHFSEGQPAAFYCNRTADGFAQLTYTDKDGVVNSTGYQQGAVTLSMNLTAAVNDDTYIVCDITDIMYEEYLQIRVKLLVNEDKSESSPDVV